MTHLRAGSGWAATPPFARATVKSRNHTDPTARSRSAQRTTVLRVAPEFADPLSAVEVREAEDVEE
jgi:hypothetical protein